MNAKEARELSEKNLGGPVIQPLLDAIYEKIRKAANEGRRSIFHPLCDMMISYPSLEQQEAVWKHLSFVDGYRVKHHPNPDPGYPGSSSYTEISWG
jgi:hypothetical protein